MFRPAAPSTVPMPALNRRFATNKLTPDQTALRQAAE
jgi:hypothetical protein